MPFETPNLIANDTPVPEQAETERFVIRPLRITDAEMDCAAVMASRERIQGTFGPDHRWPSSDLTLEQNRIDVAWHQKEHQRRDSFTYSVCDPGESVELGCLYVQPTRRDEYEAAIYFWTAEAAVEMGLAGAIESRLRQWISDDWPFTKTAYPGRDIPWSEWGPSHE